MKKTLFISLLFFAIAAKAQILTPQVISADGRFSVGVDFTLSQTIGEMTMVKTFLSSASVLTQGFQQPEKKSRVEIIDFVEIGGTLDLFPNPASDWTRLKYEFPKSGNLEMMIFNTLGQAVSQRFSENYLAGEQMLTLNTSGLAAGVYYVRTVFIAENGKQYSYNKKLEVIK